MLKKNTLEKFTCKLFLFLIIILNDFYSINIKYFMNIEFKMNYIQNVIICIPLFNSILLPKCDSMASKYAFNNCNKLF